jgi:hypothetical protein
MHDVLVGGEPLSPLKPTIAVLKERQDPNASGGSPYCQTDSTQGVMKNARIWPLPDLPLPDLFRHNIRVPLRVAKRAGSQKRV